MSAQRGLRGMIGVVHLAAMPGDPAGLPFEEVRRAAERDAERLRAGGVDAIIVENFGSSPFVRGDESDPLPAHQLAALTLISQAIKERQQLPVGVNCLRNDARAAMGIAAIADLDFIRVNVHTGAYVTDQGLIQGSAAQTLRYRKLLGAERVHIIADVLVKHATPLAPLDPLQAAKDCAYRGHADSVILTGDATGAQVEGDTLRRISGALGDRTVLIGSGLTMDNATDIAPLAHGAIVGTAFKEGGDVFAAVETDRVRELCARCRPLFLR